MKILRINVETKNINFEGELDKWRYLGGRGLTSTIISEEVFPPCDPLGEDNKLVIAPGILGGTGAPTSGRLSFGGKSPLTQGLKESNSGGTAGTYISKLGIKAIILEGYSERCNVLYINKDEVKIDEGDYLREKGTYETVSILKEKYGNIISVICIGPAGERLYPIAGIAVTDVDGNTSRYAGRGGLGAVMGSKGVKAIVLDAQGCSGKSKANIDEFNRINKEWYKELPVRVERLTKFGTMHSVVTQNAAEVMPNHNFCGKPLSDEEVNKISAQTFADTQHKRGGKTGHACQAGCPIRCSNVVVDKDGKYITSGFEYETVALAGANCDILDLDEIAKMDRFCDDFGIDTIDWGGAMSMAMESGYIKFGNLDDWWSLTEEIKNNTLMGRILAQGTGLAGKVLGAKRIIAVKGQGLPGYDPRAYKGTAVTYATSSQGACHTAGNCLPGRIGYREHTKVQLDTAKKEGMVDLSHDLQALVAINDSMGLCSFTGCNPTSLTTATNLVNAVYGTDFTFEDMVAMGEKIVAMEILFNSKAGVGISDVPQFFRKEATSVRNLTFDVPFEDMYSIWEV